MGTKEETTRKPTPKTRQEREWEEFMRQQARKMAGALDYGGMASGDFASLTPEMLEHINTAIGASSDIQRNMLEGDFANIERSTRANLAKRGQTDSSFEGISQATIGQEYLRKLADVESQRSGAVAEASLNLPFQHAQLNSQGNKDLLYALTGVSGQLISGANQYALGGFNQTSETSGVGTLAAFKPDIKVG